MEPIVVRDVLGILGRSFVEQRRAVDDGAVIVGFVGKLIEPTGRICDFRECSSLHESPIRLAVGTRKVFVVEREDRRTPARRNWRVVVLPVVVSPVVDREFHRAIVVLVIPGRARR